MQSRSLLLSMLFSGLLSAAEPQILFFAKETAKDSIHIALTIEGGQVNGSQVWQPKKEHGSRGSLSGIITGGGIIQVVHEYTIEGSTQTEEEVLKLDGAKLYMGEGELVEQKDGRLKLKDPGKAAFTTALKQVVVRQPKAGTPERQAIMDAMRTPMSAHVGKAVVFTGDLLASGSWARFHGDVTTADGKAPANEAAVNDLELDFFALLKKDANGAWQVMCSGFAGDISVRDEAREKFPKAPWMLFE